MISLTQAEINVLLKAGKRSSVLGGVDWVSLIHFSFRFVKKQIPELLEQNNLNEIIRLGFEELKTDLPELSEKDKIQFSLWLKDEMEAIVRMEQEYLTSNPKPELFAAGIDRFNKYGVLNTIISLSKIYFLKFEEIWQMKYSEVFDLQMYAKDEAEFNEALMKQKR